MRFANVFKCGSQMLSNAFKCIQMLSNASKGVQMLQIASNCFRMFQIASECFQMLPNASKCFQMLPDASECFRMHQNASPVSTKQRFRGLRSVWGLGFFYLKHRFPRFHQTKHTLLRLCTFFCDYLECYFLGRSPRNSTDEFSSAYIWSSTSSGGALAICTEEAVF